MAYLHGSVYLPALYSILKYGFGGSPVSQYLGRGIYLTRDLEIAYSYAGVDRPGDSFDGFVLEVELERTARIADIGPKPNRRTVRSLVREFGHEILDPLRAHTAIPRSKHLNRNELIEISRQASTLWT